MMVEGRFRCGDKFSFILNGVEKHLRFLKTLDVEGMNVRDGELYFVVSDVNTYEESLTSLISEGVVEEVKHR